MRAPHYSIYAVIETKDRLFVDMNGHWAKGDVELLASKLIVNGVSADRFAPDDSITRAEFASLLVRSMGLSLEHDDAYKGFEDVSQAAWYAAEVEAAVRAGLINGISADRFAPNERISREQMAVMIGRALALVINEEKVQGNNQAIDMFTDRDAISSWAKDHVAQTVSAGILKGMDDGRFAPADIATRAQAATMLARFMKAVNFID
ncbi:Endo-1,4-beta-xylanase A precursor [compost metagenome]